MDLINSLANLFCNPGLFFVGQNEIYLSGIFNKGNTQHKKTKAIIPQIGSHISLKPVFLCHSFLLLFLCRLDLFLLPMPLKKVLGPVIPQNPLFFCCLFLFFFSEVFGFLVVLVADKSFRSQKPKKSRKTKKNKKTMPLNMVLGLDIPQNPLFFFVFVFFSEVFRFLVALVADKSFRSQKPKTFEENKKNKKTMPLNKVLGPDL